MEVLTFWEAVLGGNEDEVERLLGEDPGLLNTTVGDSTPWSTALHLGHVGVLRCLLDKGRAIDERNGYGWTALGEACLDGRTPVVRLLLERGADPTIVGPRGWTPLMVAALKGHLEVVRSLLDHLRAGITINHRSDEGGMTALCSACLYGHPKIVRALLESGADPTIAFQGQDRGTPMAIAKHAGLPDGVTAEGRRGCVAALEVRSSVLLSPSLPIGTTD
jgi:hypothetical protein